MNTADYDHEFFERELAAFLPDRIFDAHVHIWREGMVPLRMEEIAGDVGYDEYMEAMETIHRGRTRGALILSFTGPEHPGHRDIMNQWVAEQTAAHPDTRGHFFITPEDDPEWVRQEVKRLGLHGLKCYHSFADVDPTWEADIPTYLPERLVRVAGEEGWTITLHMVKQRAAADQANIHWIRHYCETYPDMRMILAHSARGFQPAHNLEGLPQLTGLDNLYFDTSANCSPSAHQAILRIIGHDRLMYGSDYPVSDLRGTNLGVADSFLWLYEESPEWGEKHQRIDPVRVGLEHLRSIKWACWSERLTDQQVEDIFWNNAARLFAV